ncbi:hypothetical protein [Adhaeribacter aquaticus]|uniref:hypothetical protein n=1 Tax=Adhaeribacter aquaticus TaxID=299567 RepID=UPI0003FF51F5|nr:hypothetical protein [Adhaeribacter aquaticus]
MELKEGLKFKYLGGEFTIGAIYPDLGAGVLYTKGPNEEVYEVKIATAKQHIEDGLWKRFVCNTEDGVNIYHGEKYWGVGANRVHEVKSITGMPFALPPYHKRYSTKEAAEQALIVKVQECYKTGKACPYSCPGLCKDSY